MANTSPSLATWRRIPVASAGSSNVALSESTSAIISSNVTRSPSFFSQLARVTSVMDSPTVGTIMSLTEAAVVAATATGAAAATGAGAGAAAGAEAVALSSITQINPPISTVSPSWALIRSTPADSEGNSKVALSDSNSQRISSN